MYFASASQIPTKDGLRYATVTVIKNFKLSLNFMNPNVLFRVSQEQIIRFGDPHYSAAVHFYAVGPLRL